MRNRLLLWVPSLFVPLVFGCARTEKAVSPPATTLLTSTRPGPTKPPGARRLDNLKGLENVGEVAPGLYRGAAPGRTGLDTLKSLGVKTVVNLRHYHGTAEGEECARRAMEYVWIQLESSDAPSDEDMRRFLKIVTDPAKRPVYFHCRLGKDRTGTMCAAYRMAVEGWPLEDALREMDAFGFNKIWRDLREYVTGFPQRADAVWPPPKK